MVGISQKVPAIVGLAVGVGFVLLVFLIFQGQASRVVSSFHGTTIYIPEGAALERKNFEPRNPTVVIGLNNIVRWINQEMFAVELNIDGKCEPIREYDSMTLESSSIQIWLNQMNLLLANSTYLEAILCIWRLGLGCRER